MNRSSQRQRRAVAALVVANLFVLGGLALLVLRSTSEPGAFRASRLAPVQAEACRDAASQALLDAGHSGLVHTQEDGTILIQMQRNVITENLRFDADAATWAALEAVANGSDCLGMNAIHVSVVFSPSAQNADLYEGQCRKQSTDEARGADECNGLQSVARVSVSDIMLWSLGEIDDAELALRIYYHPPSIPSLVPRKSTAPP